MPGWLLCFAATLIVYLLQLFPLTGIFLMMFGAVLWSVILINLGFALIGVDVLRGRAPKAALLFPVLWFGGYAIATTISHVRAAHFVDALDAANRGKTFAWNAVDQDLLVRAARRNGVYFDDVDAEELMTKYGLSSIYAADGQGLYRSSLFPKACPDGGFGNRDEFGVTYTNAVDEEIVAHGITMFHHATYLCKVRRPAAPGPSPVIVTTVPYTRVRNGLVDTDEQTIKIRSGDRNPVVVKFGRAAALAWLPQPIAGCGLNSGDPSWQCFVGFQRDADATRATPTATELTAKALGLRRISLRQRFPDAGWQ